MHCNRLTLLLAITMAGACTPGSDGGTDVTPGDTSDEDGDDGTLPLTTPPAPFTDLTFTVEDVELTNPAHAPGIQGKLLLAADKTVYYAYLKYKGVEDCRPLLAAQGAPGPAYELRLARQPVGGAWSVETVPLQNVGATPRNEAYVGSTLGLDGVIDNSGNVVLAFAGGAPGNNTCASSDLVTATRSAAGQWSFAIPVDNSAACCEPVDCQSANDACRSGTDVGAWASIAKRSDGSLGIAYVDYHLFTDHDGQTQQGLELWESGGVTPIRPWAGMGRFSKLLYLSNGTAVVAYTGFTTAGGLYVRRRTATSGHKTDWAERALSNGGIGERISMAQAADGTLGLAFNSRNNTAGDVIEDLIYCRSTDNGATWKTPCEQVDALGSVGQYPSLAFDKRSRPAVSYYYCAANGDCTARADGVRFAWRDEVTNTWKRFNVHFDHSTISGLYTQLVLDPDTDEPAIAFQDPTRGAAMLARGHLTGGP